MLLGNLTVEDIQKRTGVEFPPKLVEYMKPRHQASARSIRDGKWHCFDIPFTMVCGDIKTATEIFKHLKPLSAQFKEQMRISTQG